MGFGLAGLGAAVGGAAEGYMRGEKHRSDMEDAEARRGLVKLQTDEAKLKLKQAQRDSDYQDEIASIYKDEAANQPAPGAAVQAPVATPAPAAIAAPGEVGAATPGETVSAPQARGIALPGGAAPAPAGANTLDYSDLGRMKRIIEKRHGVDMKYGKLDPEKALQMMKNFKMMEDEGVIDGMEYFRRTGDKAGAIERINKTGAMRLDPNAEFRLEPRDIGGVKFDNVVITSPDGKHSFNQYDTMVGALNPKDALNYRTTLGVQLADLANKKQAEENLNEYRKGSLRVMEQNAKTDEMYKKGVLEHYRKTDMLNEQQRLLVAEQRKDLDAARAIKLRMDASNSAFDQIMQGFGVSKEMTPEQFAMLPAAAKEKYQNGLDMAVMAHAFWKMNLDPKGNAGLDTSDAIMLAKKARSIRPEEVYKNDQGEYVTKLGGREVRVPVIMAPQEQQPGGAAVTPPSGPAPRPAFQGNPNAPVPGVVSGVDERVERARGIKTQDDAAKAEKAAQDKAKTDALRSEAQAFTIERINVLKPKEAQAVLSKYGNVLDPEQRRALNKRM